ncbi:DoxX family protein [Streptomyces sp. 4N509B]|uniref:DoxX family protein n=1 Tax=Streptomyces sp. 4N509B TaxID=3457413 RepID=UPI003FD4D9A2
MSVRDQLGGPAARGPLPGTGGPGGGLRETAAHFALLPLRFFLGFTFLYAGIDKYVDSAPFSDSMNTDQMETLLEFSRDSAAAGWLVDLALENPGLFGHGTAVVEMAVGAGLLLGLWTRLAAAAGALLALAFWLTVSWSTDPYYFGADLPLLAGFLTLLLAGSGPFALDTALSAHQARANRRMFG